MYKSLFWSVYFPSFLMSICQGSVLLIIPLFALELGADAGTAALVFAMRGLGNMAMDVPAGYSSARLGDKKTMLIGVGAMGLVGLFASQSTSPAQLGLAAFFFGGAMSNWMMARLTHITEAVHISQRGKAISSMAGLQRLGTLLGPIASGIIADQFGFLYVFIGISMVASLAFLLVVLGVKGNRVTRTEASPDFLTLVPHILVEHRKTFATAGLAILMLSVLRAGRQLLIPLWGESIGLDTTDIGLIVGLSAGIDMLMFIPAGLMMDNWGRKYAAVSCLAVMSAGMLMVPLSDTLLGLLLAGMLVGMGNGLGSGINQTLGADFSPPHERGEFLGVWRLFGDVGSFAGPIVMGYIANAVFLAATFVFASGAGVLGIAIMALFVRETLQKETLQTE